MADYDWDPTEQVLRERELEVEHISANGMAAQILAWDLCMPKQASSPATLLPAHEFTCSTDSVHLVSVSLVS